MNKNLPDFKVKPTPNPKGTIAIGEFLSALLRGGKMSHDGHQEVCIKEQFRFLHKKRLLDMTIEQSQKRFAVGFNRIDTKGFAQSIYNFDGEFAFRVTSQYPHGTKVDRAENVAIEKCDFLEHEFQTENGMEVCQVCGLSLF